MPRAVTGASYNNLGQLVNVCLSTAYAGKLPAIPNIAYEDKEHMSFLELLQKRKSCRSYCSDPVPREKIERCLEAARLAPSACNSQPWRFVVVESPQLKQEIADKAFGGVFAMNAFVRKAPVLIVVVRQRSRYAAMLGGALRGVQYSLIDVGIAGEHLALQAEEEGLGICWLGWFSERLLKKALGLGRQDKVDIVMSLGYADGQDSRLKTRKPPSEIWEFR